MTYPNLIKSKIKLTIGMLVSNHVQYIKNCMESIKPLLEKEWCELVIVDTVGPEKTDGSIEIIKQYTDKIYEFKWCDDFSAARNCILEHAKGEWLLYFDDDEWFDDVSEFISFFENGECEKYYTGLYYTRDYLPDGTYSGGIACRMIRRTENTHFEGRIHEAFNETYAPNKVFDVFTHHYGYAYKTEEDKKKHFIRNTTLINKEIDDKGLNSGMAAQLIQEYMGNEEESEKGIVLCLKFLEELKQKGEEQDSCFQWMVITVIRYYAGHASYEEMLGRKKEMLEKYAVSEVATLCINAVIASAAIEKWDFEVFFDALLRYIEKYDWINANEEQAVLQTQLDMPQFFTEEYYLNLLWYGAAFANQIGEYEVANSFWKRFPWEREGFDKAKYYADLKDTLDGLKKEEKK